MPIVSPLVIPCGGSGGKFIKNIFALLGLLWSTVTVSVTRARENIVAATSFAPACSPLVARCVDYGEAPPSLLENRENNKDLLMLGFLLRTTIGQISCQSLRQPCDPSTRF